MLKSMHANNGLVSGKRIIKKMKKNHHKLYGDNLLRFNNRLRVSDGCKYQYIEREMNAT